MYLMLISHNTDAELFSVASISPTIDGGQAHDYDNATVYILFSLKRLFIVPYGCFWHAFYRYFMYDGLEHYCLEDDHIVNLFSFSKVYGMMGWRVGYVSNKLFF